MRQALSKLVFLSVFCSLTLAQDNLPKDYAYYRQQAAQAYQAKDYQTYFSHMQAVVKLRPDNPNMKYNFAGASALVGNKQEALAILTTLTEMRLYYDAAADEDFAALKETYEFKAILKKFAQNQAPINHSEVAFKLSEKDFISEGVAYDPPTETFYFGSVHKRKIVSFDKKGAVKDFATAQAGLWSVFGMKVDAKRRTLWVCSAVMPEMQGYKKEEDGRSGVFQFDLKTGKLIKHYLLTNQPQGHVLGDLAISSNGEVYITDSKSPAVYRISPQKDELELFISAEPFRSPQGLVFSADEKFLFVADYSLGILKFDLATKQQTAIAFPEPVVKSGIDGLYFHQNSLLAIQNGINPQRVMRYHLDKNSARIERAEIVEMNNPLFNEPTLGVIARGVFYYVANSQWGSFNKAGTIFPLEKLQEPVILKMKLE